VLCTVVGRVVPVGWLVVQPAVGWVLGRDLGWVTGWAGGIVG